MTSMTTVTVSQITPRPSHSPVKLLMTRRHSKPTSDSSAPLTSSSRSQVEVRSEVRVKPLVFAPPSSASEGAFVLYLREIGRVPLLSPEEEFALAQRVRQGDRAARDHMIQANLRLVVRIARDFETFGLPLLDLISEGNIGLMTAVDRFDPMRGVRLSTYAALWIKQHMRRAIANHSRTIRVPVHVCEKLVRINRAAARLSEELSRPPTAEELAAETGFGLGAVQQLRRAIMPVISLDAPPGFEDDGRSVAETVADDRLRLAPDTLHAEEVQRMLGDSLRGLNEREQEILRRRFGLDGADPETLDQVGEAFGLTRERIRQLQQAALKKLRTRMIKKVGRNA
jgi:RNA polymerase primary sigma factor